MIGETPPQRCRRQLSLFVTPDQAIDVDAARQVLDPVQAALIPAHVTLCREDELAALPEAVWQARLAAPGIAPVALGFGPVQAFMGHGLLLPCVAGDDAFQALRRQVLGGQGLRQQQPHLTLAHPRNPQAPGNDLARAQALLPAGLRVRLATAVWIEQIGQAPWQVLASFPLGGQYR